MKWSVVAILTVVLLELVKELRKQDITHEFPKRVPNKCGHNFEW